MKKTLALFLMLAASIIANKATAQTDSTNIEHARNAIDVVHNCDDALRFLGLVSANGKLQADYMLCMANANDCKNNNEQAINYYSKYLELQPANDSVKKRLSELIDKRTAQTKLAYEERIARETYKDGQHGSHSKKSHHGKHKKSKYVTLDDNYTSWGISYGKGVSSDNPFKSTFGFNSTFGFPILDNKLDLDFAINSDFLFGANQGWYQRAFALVPGESVSAGLGLSEDLIFSPMYVIANTESIAWMAGPQIGLRYIYLSDPTTDENYSFSSGNSSFFLCYGVKTTLMVGESVLFFAEYSKTPTSTITTTNNYLGTDINHDLFRIGVCYKGFSY